MTRWSDMALLGHCDKSRMYVNFGNLYILASPQGQGHHNNIYNYVHEKITLGLYSLTHPANFPLWGKK